MEFVGIWQRKGEGEMVTPKGKGERGKGKGKIPPFPFSLFPTRRVLPNALYRISIQNSTIVLL